MAHRWRSRGPGGLYTALSVILLGMIGATAMTTRYTSPPTVAEVAPEAGNPSAEESPATISGLQSPRDEAAREAALSSPTRPVDTGAQGLPVAPGPAADRGPDQAAGGESAGPGGNGSGEPAGAAPPPATPEATTTTTTAPSVTTTTTTTTTTTPQRVPMESAPCFDDQRQIEDPQSPPCRRTGPRYSSAGPRPKGVTPEGDIVIAYPKITQLGGGNDPTGIERIWSGMERYFNAHFMFYGRKIRLVPYQPRNSFSSNLATPAAAMADAEAVNQLGAFAALGYIYDNAGNYFEDRLAQLGIVSAKGTVPPVEEEHYARPDVHPYQWSYPPTAKQIQASEAAWVCGQLQGRPPTHAGSPIHTSVATPPARKFGLIVNQFPDSLTDTSMLDDRLSGCGVTIPDDSRVEALYKNEAQATPEMTAGILRLIRQQVTTVICVCHVNAARLGFHAAAEDQRYRPEWLFTSFGHNDFQSALAFAPAEASGRRTSGIPEQMSHSLGLSFRPKTVPFDQLPLTKALAEVYGQWDWTEINAPTQNNGTQKEWSAQMYNWQYWKPLLLLASGIQQAGPELTPQTFARGDAARRYPGLQGTAFPNPETSDYAGRVGFAGDHSMVDDATVIWWSNTEPSNWGNFSYNRNPATTPRAVPGTWCYADRGRRYSFFDWAGSTSSLFTGSCY